MQVTVTFLGLFSMNTISTCTLLQMPREICPWKHNPWNIWGGVAAHTQQINMLINPRGCQVRWCTWWARNFLQHPHWDVRGSFWGIQAWAWASGRRHFPSNSYAHQKKKNRLVFRRSGHQTFWHQEGWLKTAELQERLKELNMPNLAKQWVRGDVIKDSRHLNEGSGVALKDWIKYLSEKWIHQRSLKR